MPQNTWEQHLLNLSHLTLNHLNGQPILVELGNVFLGKK